LKLFNREEMENLMKTIYDFFGWMDFELNKHSTKEINLNKRWMLNECEEFIEEYGVSIPDLEEGYY
jgi:hypothetical protein